MRAYNIRCRNPAFLELQSTVNIGCIVRDGSPVSHVSAQQGTEHHDLGQEEYPHSELARGYTGPEGVIPYDFHTFLGILIPVVLYPHHESSDHPRNSENENEPVSRITFIILATGRCHDQSNEHQGDSYTEYEGCGSPMMSMFLAHSASSADLSVGISVKLLCGGGELVVHSSDQPSHGSSPASSPYL